MHNNTVLCIYASEFAGNAVQLIIKGWIRDERLELSFSLAEPPPLSARGRTTSFSCTKLSFIFPGFESFFPIAKCDVGISNNNDPEHFFVEMK